MLKSYFGLGTRVSGRGFIAALLSLLVVLLAPLSAVAQNHEHSTPTPADPFDTLPSLRDAPVPPNRHAFQTHFEGELPLRPGRQDLPDPVLQRSASSSIFA